MNSGYGVKHFGNGDYTMAHSMPSHVSSNVWSSHKVEASTNRQYIQEGRETQTNAINLAADNNTFLMLSSDSSTQFGDYTQPNFNGLSPKKTDYPKKYKLNPEAEEYIPLEMRNNSHITEKNRETIVQNIENKMNLPILQENNYGFIAGPYFQPHMSEQCNHVSPTENRVIGPYSDISMCNMQAYFPLDFRDSVSSRSQFDDSRCLGRVEGDFMRPQLSVFQIGVNFQSGNPLFQGSEAIMQKKSECNNACEFPATHSFVSNGGEVAGTYTFTNGVYNETHPGVSSNSNQGVNVKLKQQTLSENLIDTSELSAKENVKQYSSDDCTSVMHCIESNVNESLDKNRKNQCNIYKSNNLEEETKLGVSNQSLSAKSCEFIPNVSKEDLTGNAIVKPEKQLAMRQNVTGYPENCHASDAGRNQITAENNSMDHLGGQAYIFSDELTNNVKEVDTNEKCESSEERLESDNSISEKGNEFSSSELDEVSLEGTLSDMDSSDSDSDDDSEESDLDECCKTSGIGLNKSASEIDESDDESDGYICFKDDFEGESGTSDNESSTSIDNTPESEDKLDACIKAKENKSFGLFFIISPSDSESSQSHSDHEDNESDYSGDLFSLKLDDSWGSCGGLCMSNIISGTPSSNDSLSYFDLDGDEVDSCLEGSSKEYLAKVNEEWEKEIVKNCAVNTPEIIKFCDSVQIIPVVDWCRRGPWEEYARDRMRFRRRIEETESILSPILTPEHRQKVYSEL